MFPVFFSETKSTTKEEWSPPNLKQNLWEDGMIFHVESLGFGWFLVPTLPNKHVTTNVLHPKVFHTTNLPGFNFIDQLEVLILKWPSYQAQQQIFC